MSKLNAPLLLLFDTNIHASTQPSLGGVCLCRCSGDFGMQRHGERRASRSGHHEGGEGSQSSRQATGSGWHQIYLPVCWEYLQQWVARTTQRNATLQYSLSTHNLCGIYFVFQTRRLFTIWSTMRVWLCALTPPQRTDMRCSLESITWVGDQKFLGKWSLLVG